MSELVKNLGVIVLLIGVIILAVPAITGGVTNTILIAGLAVIILGYVGHIVINKKMAMLRRGPRLPLCRQGHW